MKTPGLERWDAVERLSEDVRQIFMKLVQENERLVRTVRALEDENRGLKEMLQNAAQVVHAREGELDRLLHLVDEVSVSNTDLTGQLEELMQQITAMTNLYVSAYQLLRSLDPAEVLCAVEEIVINLIGCEHYVVARVAGEVEVLGSMGLDAEYLAGLRPDDPLLGALRDHGRVITEPNGVPLALAGRKAVAAIPLRVGDRVEGAIVILRLLPQKDGLNFDDHELMELLASRAGIALQIAAMLG